MNRHREKAQFAGGYLAQSTRCPFCQEMLLRQPRLVHRCCQGGLWRMGNTHFPEGQKKSWMIRSPWTHRSPPVPMGRHRKFSTDRVPGALCLKPHVYSSRDRGGHVHSDRLFRERKATPPPSTPDIRTVQEHLLPQPVDPHSRGGFCLQLRTASPRAPAQRRGPLAAPGDVLWPSAGLNALRDAPKANEDAFQQPVNKWFPAAFLTETAAPYSEIPNMFREVKKTHQNQQKNPSMTALTRVKGNVQ